MNKTAAAMLALALLQGGCDEDMRKDTTHTFYLDPDGAVTWMVLEKDIHSVAEDLQERRQGEETLLAERRSGQYDIARGLEVLDPIWIETKILREERPYMVTTEARFASIDQMLQSFMDPSGGRITVDLRLDGNRVRLLVMYDFDAPEDSERDEGFEGESEALLALLADAEDYRVVLTNGKFIGARGFRIEEKGSVAILLEQSDEDVEEIDEVDEFGGTVVYSLTWQLPHQDAPNGLSTMHGT